MFKIGDFAKINKVTVKALRHYEHLGLLRPEKTDASSGYRYYNASQMPRLNRILALKDIGFSLEEIAFILEKQMNADELTNLLMLKQKETLNKIQSENARLLRINTYLNTCKQEAKAMTYDIIIKKIDPIRVATLRDKIPSYSAQGHLWEELGTHIEKHGAKIVPPCMIIYHEPGYTEETVDAEVIEPIEGNLPETDRIQVKMLEGAEEMACVIHQGPYENLNQAYAAIMTWIEQNGYKIAGLSRELYLKGEWLTPDPNAFITEIQFPVSRD